MQQHELSELITFVARSLVDESDEVSVRSAPSDGGAVLELRVAPGDLGKVIGRRGTTARAIRTVLAAASHKRQQRAVLNIIEE